MLRLSPTHAVNVDPYRVRQVFARGARVTV